MAKIADEFYLTAEWEKLRLSALRAAGWKCRQCGCGVRGAKAGQSRPVVDHVVNRKQGGKDELANLQVLCLSCHNKKTKWVDYNTKVPVGLSGLAPGWED